MKKQLKRDLLFSILLTLFALFGFYIGEELLNLSEKSVSFMAFFWFVVFFISFKIIRYFLNMKWQ